MEAHLAASERLFFFSLQILNRTAETKLELVSRSTTRNETKRYTRRLLAQSPNSTPWQARLAQAETDQNEGTACCATTASAGFFTPFTLSVRVSTYISRTRP